MWLIVCSVLFLLLWEDYAFMESKDSKKPVKKYSELDEPVQQPKKKMSRFKRRRLRRKHRRILYRAIHQDDVNPVLYCIEIMFGICCESIRLFLSFVCYSIILCAVVGCIIGVKVGKKYYPMYKQYDKEALDIVSHSTKSDFQINESTTILNANDKVIAVVRENADSKYLEYDDIPQYVIDAFIAVEDRTFWQNDGVDYEGIIRVMYRYFMTTGDEVHGASTITQQLVRNNFLTREVSLERKAKEILIARHLTEQYSKRDIIEFYVNDICYANGIYGISGAAKAYFNKDVDDLTLSQIAYLCAIPNSPTYYDPYANYKNALERRDKILDDMFECGYITENEKDLAKMELITIEKPVQVFNDYETTFAVDCAVKYLMKLDGFDFEYKFDSTEAYKLYHKYYDEEYEKMRHKLYTGGYTIKTSLDSDAYRDLQKILDDGLAFDDEINEETGIYALQGALTVIDNSNGKVVALVGGRSQDNDNNVYSLNRAFQSYRQPGSSIKPLIVYTPALETGYTAETVVQNIDVTSAKDKGADVQSMTGTAMTLREAVEKSRNGVAWQIFDKLTPSVGLSYLENMNYSNLCPDDYYNATALGGMTYGVTTVEQASGFSTLANHGTYREPTCITSILDKNGEEVFTDYETKEIYKDKAADDMVDILKGVLTHGTASSLRWGSLSDKEAFAKTGTTNDSKDGWLCGATPYYSIAVWVGYDTPRTLSNLYGATYPGAIWKSAMLYMTDNLEPAQFTRNEIDSSYDEKLLSPEQEEGYYSYLPGRDDSEVLSEGYTVGDYRSDRVIGESVHAICENIVALDMSQPNANETLAQYYNEALAIIDTVYSRKYTNELQGDLNTAYNSKISGQTLPAQPVDQPAEVVQP